MQVKYLESESGTIEANGTAITGTYDVSNQAGLPPSWPLGPPQSLWVCQSEIKSGGTVRDTTTIVF